MLSVVPSLCSLESMVLIDNSLDEALKFLAPLAVFSVQSSNQPPNSDQLGYQICSSCKQLSIATEYHQQANCSTRVTIIILQFPSTLHTYAISLINSLCIHTTQSFSSLFKPPPSIPSHPSLLNLASSPTPHKGSEHLTPELSPLPVMKLTNLPHICTFLVYSPHKKIKEVCLPIFGNHSPIFSVHRAVVKYKCYNPHMQSTMYDTLQSIH